MPNYRQQPRGRHQTIQPQVYSNYPRESRATRQAHARGYRQFQNYDTSAIKPQKKRWPKIVGTIIALLVVVGLIIGAVMLFKSCSNSGEAGGSLPEGKQVAFVIEEGSNASAVANNLAKAGLIGDASKFTKRLTERKADTSLAAGTYTLTAGMTIDEIIDAFLKGPGMSIYTVTVPEGARLTEIAAAVEKTTGGRVTAAAFLEQASDASKYANTYPFLAEAGSNSLEGFLFPKTYDVGQNGTADSIIQMMLAQFQKETASLNYSYPESQGLSKYETLILASIVEKEGSPNTKSKIASVFYNRLAIDMALQSDATTMYEVGHEPTPEDVHADTPYGTYARTGLTPTPICSPSLDALQAVCNPEKTNYLYFVFKTDSDGVLQCYFSETYDEHLAAIG